MYINNFNIIKSRAAFTYGKLDGGALEIKAGSNKSRINFSSHTDGSVPTNANVYAKVISKNSLGSIKSFFLNLNNKFVKTQYHNTTLYVNIKSLSTRLGIPVKEIYRAAKSKDKSALDKLIANYHKDYLKTEEKVDDQLNKIIKEKYIQENDQLKTPEDRKISKATLRHILAIAAFSKFNSKNAEEIGYVLKDKSILHLKKQEGSECPLATLFSKKVLAKGSYGTVKVAQELSLGRQCIAKMPTLAGQTQASNEVRILKKIFKNNSSCVGIQKAPSEEFDFKIGKTRHFGYIAPQYDSDLLKVIPNLSDNEKIDCARQLLSGLVELRKQNIGHGDIKEENCLYMKSKGSAKYVISDFGGAKDLSNDASWPVFYTPLYLCSSDREAFFTLFHSINSRYPQEELDRIIDKLNVLIYARDVYAMGIIFLNLLKKLNIHNSDKTQDLQVLIKKMTSKSYENRITASEALGEFNKIFPLNNEYNV